ncbi:MAG: hypothetical protein LBJ00_06840 [Planctomycetaceae bacterium]|nr:hypothetical protein [Planctomycetaceae bacterium]
MTLFSTNILSLTGQNRHLFITDQQLHNLTPCGAFNLGASDSAVALRYTTGYAHHAPCGATENIHLLKFQGYCSQKCRFWEVPIYIQGNF